MLSTYEATYKWQAWEDNKGESNPASERLVFLPGRGGDGHAPARQAWECELGPGGRICRSGHASPDSCWPFRAV